MSMPNLRKLAKGKPCQVRIPHCCTFQDEQTILAHLRKGGVAGMSQKPHDLIGVWACHNCHAVIDGREFLPGLSPLELDRYVLEGLCRTLAEVGKTL